jgi:hypothetical protein
MILEVRYSVEIDLYVEDICEELKIDKNSVKEIGVKYNTVHLYLDDDTKRSYQLGEIDVCTKRADQVRLLTDDYEDISDNAETVEYPFRDKQVDSES